MHPASGRPRLRGVIMVLLGITMMPAWSAFQLRRASLDAAGGGSAESDSYQIVVAYGQHDADQAAFSAHYTWQGGVYAQLPGNVIFADGFEVD